MTSERWGHHRRRHGPRTTENNAELGAEPIRHLSRDLDINEDANPDTAPTLDMDATSSATRPPRAREGQLRVVGVDTEPLDAARHREAVSALAALIDQWHHHIGTEIDVQDNDARVHDSHDSDSRAA